MKDSIPYNDIHVIEGRAGCVYIAGAGESFMLVDCGFPSDMKRLFKYIEDKMGGRPEWIKLAVLTHSHFDHVSGIDKIVKATGCGAAASSNALEYLAGRKALPVTSFISYLKFGWFMITNGFPSPSFTDWFTMPWAGIPGIKKGIKTVITHQIEDGQEAPGFPEWKAILTPGHTPDGMCLYNRKTKTLFSGDTVINDKGTVKLNPLLTHDKAALAKSLEKLKQYEVDYLCPGWGMPVRGSNLLGGINAAV